MRASVDAHPLPLLLLRYLPDTRAADKRLTGEATNTAPPFEDRGAAACYRLALTAHHMRWYEGKLGDVALPWGIHVGENRTYLPTYMRACFAFMMRKSLLRFCAACSSHPRCYFLPAVASAAAGCSRTRVHVW